MKNASKKSWLTALPLLFGLALLAPLASAFTVPPGTCVTCNPPSVTVGEKSAGSVTFNWAPVSGATAYRVYYSRLEDSYTSAPVSTGNTSIGFSGLPAGTYKFYFCTVCEENTVSSFILEDLLM